jgi:hypothetical protein
MEVFFLVLGIWECFVDMVFCVSTDAIGSMNAVNKYISRFDGRIEPMWWKLVMGDKMRHVLC